MTAARGSSAPRSAASPHPVAADRAALSVDFRALFEATPTACIVVAPRDFAIVAVNDAYLRATLTERSAILGCTLFNVFPDNPADPEASGVANLRASFERVLATRRGDTVPIQKHDIGRPFPANSAFEPRWWSWVNTPLLSANGEVTAIIHGVEDVTEIMRREEEVQDRIVRDRQLVTDQLREANEAVVQAVARARISEVLTGTLVAQLPGAAVFVVDESLRYFVADGEALAAAGLSSAALVGRTVGEAFGTRAEADYAPFYRRALAGESFSREHEDHGRVYLTRGAPLRDDEGHVYAALAISTDITTRRRAEEALSRSEARYRTLFESIDEGFCLIEVIFDTAGAAVDYRFLETNPAFVQQTGLANAEGRTMRELAPTHEAHWFDTYGRIALTGEPARFEARADALGRWYDVYAFRVEDPSERRVGIVFRDVGPRKRIEAALIASEARYRAIATASADVIYSMSPDWTEMRQLGGRGFLSNTMEETQAWLSRYIHPDDQAQVTESIKEAVQTTRPFELEHRVVRADGSLGWTLSRAVPVLGDDGSIVEWIGAAKDVTARLEAETALRASKERQAFLLALSDALRLKSDAREIMGTAAEMIGRYLKVGVVQYLLIDPDGDGFQVAAGYDDGTIERGAAKRGRISDFGPDWGPQLRAGEAVFSDDHDTRSPADAAATRRLAIRSGSAIPLLRDAQLVAVLATGHSEARRWTEGEKSLQIEVAERTWAAVARARAEVDLRRSEAKYRTIFNSIDEGFGTLEVLYDADGYAVDLRYLETNGAFERHSGIAGAAGRTASEMLPGLESEWLETYARIARTGESERFEQYVTHTNRWFSVYMSRVGGPGSSVVAAVFNDITERKHAESALVAVAARDAFLVRLGDALRPLADPMAVQAVAARLLGEHLGANQVHYGELVDEAIVVHQGYGNELPPMVGTFSHAGEGWGAQVLENYLAGHTAICYDVEADSTISSALAEVIAGGGFRSYVAVPLVKNGEWVAVFSVTSIAPRAWRADEVALAEEVAERIWSAVERAKAATALRVSESRYRTLVTNVPDYAIFLLDADGIVTDWTAGAERVKGYTAEEVIGRHISLFYTQEAVATGEPARELAEAAGAGRAEHEGWRVRKGGVRFWANEIATAVRDSGGRLCGFTNISRDLTERRRGEAAAELARAAGERDALRRRLATVEEDERRRLSRELHDEAGQHLTGLALGLQALSDVTPAGSEVDRRAAELRVLADTLGRELHAIAVRLRPRALDDFGLEAALSSYAEDWSRQCSVPLDIYARVHAERLPVAVEGALFRIVQEALSNIARHSGATRASVLIERGDGDVVAVVEDNGRGFKHDHAVAMHDLDAGLGLVGMRERTTLLGGSLEIESRPGGGGTTLFIRIPITHPQDEAHDAGEKERA